MATAAPQAAPSSTAFKDKEKPMAVRASNILAARAVADAIRTVCVQTNCKDEGLIRYTVTGTQGNGQDDPNSQRKHHYH
jgi:hypothetical protein